MPVYEYLCECGKKFQTIQSFNEPKLKTCTIQDTNSLPGKACEKEGKVQRLISKPTLLKLGHLSDKKLRADLGDNIINEQ